MNVSVKYKESKYKELDLKYDNNLTTSINSSIRIVFHVKTLLLK